jgi:hypothetical protein
MVSPEFQEGIARLNASYTQSVNHVNWVNNNTHDGHPEPNPPLALTEEQHWLNALSLYRKGGTNYYYGYHFVSGTTYEWVSNSGTGPDYADSVVGYMSSQPWND